MLLHLAYWPQEAGGETAGTLERCHPHHGLSLHDFSIDALNHLNVASFHWCTLEM